MECPNCHNPIADPTACFCSGCGQPLPRNLNCTACGKPLEPGMNFCGQCGAPVGGEPPIDASASQPAERYCKGSGSIILPGDRHFRCADCDGLFLEQYRFEQQPICQFCAQKQGMDDVLARERAKQEAELQARLEQAETQRRQKEQAEREAEAKRCANALKCPHTGMEFVEVPGGQFDMGDLWGDGDDSEKPIHSVNIQAFLLGKTPVTQAQWQVVMGDNPAEWSGANFVGSNKSVVNVSWEDAQSFIRKLNSLGEGGFHLPSEAQWEYAARSGGKRHKWAGCNSESELTDYAWYSKNSNSQTQPVAQKRPNDLGLHDMSGNVFEWCEDEFHGNYQGAPSDGSAWLSVEGDTRVLRGGAWDTRPTWLRSAYRHYGHAPGKRCLTIGFRLARIKR